MVNKRIIIFLGLLFSVVLFQNCGNFSAKTIKSLSSSLDSISTSSSVQCPPNYIKQGSLCVPPTPGEAYKTHFGIMYSLWHCPFSQTNENTTQNVFDIHQLLSTGNSFGPAGSWHWWTQPQDGYYCLTQNEDVLKKHAILLRDAGVDFIFIDSTNHPTTDGQSDRPDQMILRPFEKLLQVWSQIPGAPRVVPWAPVTNHSNPMIDRLLQMLAQYPHLQYIKNSKPYFMVTSNPNDPLKVDPNHLNSLAQSYSYDKMWAINTKVLESDEFSYLSPCAANFKSSGGLADCNQHVTVHNGAKKHLSISSGVNQFMMSEPQQSTPRFGGRTLTKQFQTLFNHPTTEIATITSFNEWIAINHCMTASGNLTTQSSQCPSNKGYFVDLYNLEYSRDIEPSRQFGDKYYKLTKACISRYKRGLASCDATSADELPTVPTGDSMTDSVARACSYPGDSNLPATSQGQLTGNIDGISLENDRAILKGWVCIVGKNTPTDFHVYLDNSAGKGTFFGQGRTSLVAEQAIHDVCGTSATVPHRFSVDITNWIGVDSGRSLYIHGINPDNQLNYYIYNSGRCVIPWPSMEKPIPPQPMDQYEWSTSEFGACSSQPSWVTSDWSTCQQGQRRRTVQCTNTTGQRSRSVFCLKNGTTPVEDQFCGGQKPTTQMSCENMCSGTPPATTQSCDIEVANYNWSTSDWSACDAQPQWSIGEWSSCHQGLQNRAVQCTGTLGKQNRTVVCKKNNLETVADSFCMSQKPSHMNSCQKSCMSSQPEASRSCESPKIPTAAIFRSYHGVGIEHLFSLSSTEGPSAGFAAEGIGFYVVTQSLPSTIELYRCWVPGFKHFVSTNAQCEGQQVDGSLGFIYSQEQPQTVPLYRKFHPVTQDHFVTTQRTEGSEHGYIEVSVLGYVPLQ